MIFVNSIDRCYRLKLFLEQFSIPSCVLNSELPVNSRYAHGEICDIAFTCLFGVQLRRIAGRCKMFGFYWSQSDSFGENLLRFLNGDLVALFPQVPRRQSVQRRPVRHTDRCRRTGARHACVTTETQARQTQIVSRPCDLMSVGANQAKES